MTATIALMIIFAYFLGSISSAILLCRLAGLPDPRTTGSTNPGATNVLRLGNKTLASIVLILDMLKGAIPVWGAYFLDITPFYLGLIAISACLGHIYPIFFHFQGGKGVATALGAMAPIGLDLTALIMATWAVVALIFRYSSLASITAVLAAPLYTWWIKPEYTLPVAMLSCLILYRHNDNLQRLLKGQEPKFK
ncbi:glycerol-3-phosphate 1-O-acyltransferase PlsY [Vibrio sp.]|nr:glycerol-3-phosphate 1-O-acyltransferase PlsY [Vibrio sp.]